ncbi:spermidine/putrescine ABC transporter ATP-binding protein [Rhizobium sp. AC44/96]|uniref:ABC transporter ATP-binding protein n=1 Tax=Rhizobium sp. AC44/96 TaxID=1841654 RepID=UPI00080FBCC9|nr:ABC transporter ATP-binding protein [Rhizobium sp. AC44/96]OCJ07907.1 spermidine/putrescine ABC transporter ATP-binding protein [Rhizobium sp. AC44/96]
MTQLNAVEIRSVSKFFGFGEYAVAAVNETSLAIRQNEFFTLLGPSGCGKTTLLRLIAGFEFPTHGEILLDGENIAAMPPFKRPINTVFQNYALFPHMTVGENIAFGLQMLGRPKAEVAERVAAMLKLVRMEALANRRTSEISGGQQQRVALARALAPRPKVLLLDEPLSALDYKLRKEMQIELKRLQAETGITFIFVTHDQEEALTMSDRIAVLSAGKVLQVGAPRDIYDAPADRFVADFIGETNFLEGRVIAFSGQHADVHLKAGGQIRAAVPSDFTPDGDVTVVLRPEHAGFCAPEEASGAGGIRGALTNIIYSGTDTHYHVRLSDGATSFTIRQQNKPNQSIGLAVGDEVGIAFAPNAARVLRG